MLLKTISGPIGVNRAAPAGNRLRICVADVVSDSCDLAEDAKMPGKGQRHLEFITIAGGLHELVDRELRLFREVSVIVNDDTSTGRHAAIEEFQGVLDRIVEVE